MLVVAEEILNGGPENAGTVVRIGDTVRRPRGAGHVVVEALLIHLESVGFTGSPRLRGIDRSDRQILDYLDGETHATPPWQQDDDANAAALGVLAGWLRRLHVATSSFQPPGEHEPKRALPIPGDVWTHGDVGYPNIVYRQREIVGLIDWEFAAPAHRCCDLAGLIATAVRAPRHDAEDNDRRERAVKLAMSAVATSYGLADSEVALLPSMAAAVIDDLVTFKGSLMDETNRCGWQWRAAWFRDNSHALSAL
jgi:Ser/Thr protein kinase RdoA (MazF antagonist)